MKDSGKPPSVIHLSDRRATPKELPAFARELPAEDPRNSSFWQCMRVFKEEGAQLHVQLLAQLLPLVLPEFRRFAFPSVRSWHRAAWKVPEDKVKIRDLETRFGSYPIRMRKEKWLDERSFRLEGLTEPRGMRNAELGDSGITLGRELYLLASGQLVIAEPVGFWHLSADHRFDTLLTVLASAERVEPSEALEHFALHSLLPALRALLWYDRLPALAPPAADLEARRERFMTRVKALSQATAHAHEQLRPLVSGPG